MPRSYNLYVIELDPEVLKVAQFRNANPQHRDDKPCVYVGQTALEPEDRFLQHVTGIHSNKYVRRYGLRLRERNYRNHQGYATRAEAEREEELLAERLRKKGYAVWYG
jgi:hypothetical protein